MISHQKMAKHGQIGQKFKKIQNKVETALQKQCCFMEIYEKDHIRLDILEFFSK